MTFAPPTPSQQLAALESIATELGGAADEAACVERALDALATLLPGRALAIRILDVRTREPARSYLRGAALRAGVLGDGVTITEAALARAGLKSAVAASARLAIRERWDSPFTGMAHRVRAPARGGRRALRRARCRVRARRGRARHRRAGRARAREPRPRSRCARYGSPTTPLGLRDYQSRLLESANALILGIDRNWRVTVCKPRAARPRGRLARSGARAATCATSSPQTSAST